MAQMAAQDYFSRLQMSGMVHPDMANFAALGNLNSFHNNSAITASSSGNKNNLKRKDKVSSQDDFKQSINSKEVIITFSVMSFVFITLNILENVKRQSTINAQYIKPSKRTFSNVSGSFIECCKRSRSTIK